MLSIVDFSLKKIHVNGVIFNNLFRLLPLRQDVPRLAMFTGLPDSHFKVQDFFECKELLVPHFPKCWDYKCVHISEVL